MTKNERRQIAEILNRRANEVAEFSRSYRSNLGHLGSVELSLTREIDRLRHLADRIEPTEPGDES